MPTLITGGAGFIGSHLADHLLRQGEEVLAYDNLSTGSRQNIAHLDNHPHFSFVEGSVTDPERLAPLVAKADWIFHLAAVVGVRRVVENPVATITTNVHGTENVLQLASELGKKVLLVSSSEVYGRSEILPFAENSGIVLGSTERPRWSYACSKAMDEFLAFAYHRSRNLSVVVARLFNTVGPRQTGQYGMVLPRFAEQALRGDPITVFGDGTQTRCFTHVADVVDALSRLTRSDAAIGSVFNIGNDEEVSIGEVAKKVREKTGCGSEIVFVPFAEAYDDAFEDIRRRVPDLSRIRDAIGPVATRSLDDILDDIIAFTQASIDSEESR